MPIHAARAAADSDSLDAAAMVAGGFPAGQRGALRTTYVYSYIHSAAGPFSPISVNQSSSQITPGCRDCCFLNGETTIFRRRRLSLPPIARPRKSASA